MEKNKKLVTRSQILWIIAKESPLYDKNGEPFPEVKLFSSVLSEVIMDCGLTRDTFQNKSAMTFVNYNLHEKICYMIGISPRFFLSVLEDHLKNRGLDYSWVRSGDLSFKKQKLSESEICHNKTGFAGVRQNKTKFYSTLKLFGKYIHVGVFDTAKAAYDARIKKRDQILGLI